MTMPQPEPRPAGTPGPISRPQPEEQQGPKGTPRPAEQQEAFILRLLALLQETPVEAGYAHPAEAFIAETARQSEQVHRWVLAAYNQLQWRSSPLTADLLSCLAGLSAVRSLVMRIVTLQMLVWGLDHRDVVVRDAAARGLEHLGDRRFIDELSRRAAKEQVPWLAAYMRDVVADLSGQASNQ